MTVLQSLGRMQQVFSHSLLLGKNEAATLLPALGLFATAILVEGQWLRGDCDII